LTEVIRELEMIALARDIPEFGLKAGDIGCVVLIHGGGSGFEVEFATITGDTLAIITLPPDALRPVKGNEIPHARAVA